MDFRGFSKCQSTRPVTQSTVVTPQLEDYELFRNFRELPKYVSCTENQPFMLVFNVASLLESELEIIRVLNNAQQDRDVLQVEVMHSMKETKGVAPFSRMATYRFILPEELSDKPLSAIWTIDSFLIFVESSNINSNLIDSSLIESSNNVEPKEGTCVDPSVKGVVKYIKPIMVDCVYNPTVNVDVVRHAVALAEHDLFTVKKTVQNGSFVRPDIGRLPRSEMGFIKPNPVKENSFTSCKKQLEVCIEHFEHLLKIVGEKEMEKSDP